MNDEVAAGPAMSDGDLVAAVAQLNANVAALSEVVRENTAYLKRKISALEQADQRRKLSIRLMFITIVADIVATSIGLVVLHRQADTNHKLQESLRQNYVTAAQQAETRVKVLCPLYSFVLSVGSSGVRADLPPDRQKILDAELDVFRKGYAALACAPPLTR